MRNGDSQLRSVHFVFDALSEARDRTALIRIIGIGSPFGDDAAGLEVARMSAPRRRRIARSSRPIARVRSWWSCWKTSTP